MWIGPNKPINTNVIETEWKLVNQAKPVWEPVKQVALLFPRAAYRLLLSIGLFSPVQFQKWRKQDATNKRNTTMRVRRRKEPQIGRMVRIAALPHTLSFDGSRSGHEHDTISNRQKSNPIAVTTATEDNANRSEHEHDMNTN